MSTSEIMGLGDDQMSNMFRISFPTGIPGGGDGKSLAMRMDQSLDIPERAVSTYEFFFKGKKVTKTGTSEESATDLTFDIRLDQGWQQYDSLSNWLKLVADFEKGVFMDSASCQTSMVFEAIGRNDEVVKTIVFKGVVLKGLNISAWDNGGTDPTRVTANFIFLSYD